jgi:predicted aldo/keto reductase-like oxidoreductase
MDKIRLGKTEMMVSRIGFGGIPIQRDNEEEAVAVVKRCLELGITFLDTANGYTTSEERIGKAIAGKRKEVIIATKSGGRDRKTVEEHLKLSLKRLNTNYIDLYQFHGVSTPEHLKAVLALNGPITAVEEAKKAGVVRHIGVTSHQIDIAKEAVKTGRFETVLFPFNFIAREPAEDLRKLCQTLDVGVIAMKPLAGGMLDNVKIAFKFLFQYPDVLPIPGIEKVHEIEEIVGLLDKSTKLSAADKREMQRLRDELGNQFCRRCDYCQPCTMGITISSVMTSDTIAKRLPPERLFSGQFADSIEKARSCSECGECETRCPYHLPIRELIKKRIEGFEAAKKAYEKQHKTKK